MVEQRPRTVWIDVDGTAETGSPASWDACQRNLECLPTGRTYNYNFLLFEALSQAKDVDLAAMWLFTAYDARGAGNTLGVVRCELLDWLATAYPNFGVAGVATIIDPAYCHGPGAYYRAVIEPVERATLRKSGVEHADVSLDGNEVIHTVSPEDWQTVVPLTYREILEREEQMVRIFCCAPQADSNRGRCKKLDKETLARYFFATKPTDVAPRVLFLDDRLDYLQQVRSACCSCGADGLLVHVTPALHEVRQYLALIDPAQSGSWCAIS